MIHFHFNEREPVQSDLAGSNGESEIEQSIVKQRKSPDFLTPDRHGKRSNGRLRDLTRNIEMSRKNFLLFTNIFMFVSVLLVSVCVCIVRVSSVSVSIFCV